MIDPAQAAKLAAARHASRLVEGGMTVGLGTGSTAGLLVDCLGERVRAEGLRLRAVPTSERAATLAAAAGIEVVDLGTVRWLDLTIDGADEIDPDLQLLKGGGGAHLREKIVATASDRVVVIADASKRVDRLGRFPVPVEVVPFGWPTTQALIEETLIGLDLDGRQVTLRQQDGRPVVTDGGNYLLDLHLGRIGQPRQLSLVLNQVPGVVENGLFLDICDLAVIGHPDGRVEVRDLAEERLGPAPAEAENIFGEVAE